jgi:hypothetical protein
MKKNNAPSDRLFEKVFEAEKQRRVEQAESEARQREAEEKTASKRRRRTAFRVITTFVLIVAVLAVLLFAIYFFFFRISELNAVGNEKYTAEEIFKTAGVNKGDHLYSFSSKIACNRLKKYLPYIKGLTVKRDVPGTITFTVEEHKARYYADIYGRTFILSEDLTVVEILSGKEVREDLCFLALPAVRRAVCGEKIVFRSETDENHVYSIVGLLPDAELYDRITALIVSDTYSLSMECDHKYLMNFGNYSDPEIKLRLASLVLKDEMFDSANKMKIDLSDTFETTVVIDNTLVLH